MKQIDYVADLSGSLRLSENGEWFHNGVRFQNQRLAKLFHSSIVWDEAESSYFLEIGRQRARFDCDDTAYFVCDILVAGSDCLITLLDGSQQKFHPETLRSAADGHIYCTLLSGHRARLTRGAHQQLLAKVDEDGTILLAGKRLYISEC